LNFYCLNAPKHKRRPDEIESFMKLLQESHFMTARHVGDYDQFSVGSNEMAFLLEVSRRPKSTLSIWLQSLYWASAVIEEYDIPVRCISLIYFLVE